MFVDRVCIKVASGNGGNGIATWHKEKFISHGGPDGGDGGHGGSVYLLADNSLNTLLDFKYKSIFKADDGTKGARNNCTGKSGEDLVIKVPCGTIVRDANHENIAIADLLQAGDKVMVAEGGRGGRGNSRFKSNTNKSPYYCEPGEPSIERDIELELKLIADVGIVGFPNAGKSTFISRISAAKPKIADYAFTTLQPNLGVVKKQSGDGYTVADIPGLIEGASKGSGLGHEFLRHIERTKFLVHMVDVWGFTGSNIDSFDEKWYQNPIDNYRRINQELENFSSILADKKQIVVINKVEAYPQEELEPIKAQFEAVTRSDNKVIGLYFISAVSGNALEDLLQAIETAVDEIEVDQKETLLHVDDYATDHDDTNFEITEQKIKGEVVWGIYCGKLERYMAITNIREPESLKQLYKVAKGIGVFEALKERGAMLGDTLQIAGIDFEVDDMVLA